ncbi:MAG: zinc ribbon domain-containing protein [Lachnospiraceae bacterium]
MIYMIIGIITILVLLLTLVGIIYYAYRRIRRKVRDFSQMAFGTDSLMKGFQKVETEYEETPKSVSAGTSLYLPRITKDFPDFHYDEMKNRAENVLVSYLRAVDMQDVSQLTEGLEEFKDQLRMRINMLSSRGEREHFAQTKIHKTAIYQYRKLQGKCSIVFQMAVQYYYHKERNGTVIAGSPNNKKQSRYNVECIYIQDREFLENLEDTSLARNCPNCGAPLSGLGATKCEYCGTPVLDLNVKHSWYFSSVKEV